MERCKGTTKRGAPCSRPAGPYGYCRQHDPLTDKQRAFVDEYLVDLNAAAAARRAGYSEGSARSIGHENLTKPDIRRAIDERLKERAMTADEALARLAEMARGTIAPFVRVLEAEGGPVALIDLTAESAQRSLHLVRKLKITERQLSAKLVEVKTELELHDAKDALVQILKIHGRYKEQVEHSVEPASAAEIATLLGLRWHDSEGEQDD